MSSLLPIWQNQEHHPINTDPITNLHHSYRDCEEILISLHYWSRFCLLVKCYCTVLLSKQEHCLWIDIRGCCGTSADWIGLLCDFQTLKEIFFTLQCYVVRLFLWCSVYLCSYCYHFLCIQLQWFMCKTRCMTPFTPLIMKCWKK